MSCTDDELDMLVQEIKRLGEATDDGLTILKFGDLTCDQTCVSRFNSLPDVLKAAKRKNVVTYHGDLLLPYVDHNVEIILVRQY